MRKGLRVTARYFLHREICNPTLKSTVQLGWRARWVCLAGVINLVEFFFINSASTKLKWWSITSILHLRVDWFINASTDEFCCPKIIREVTFGWNFVGSQLSPHIFICFPSPTLHKIPFRIPSLTWKILLHAYEANADSLASKIVPFGKNLAWILYAFKTLDTILY